MEATKKLNGKSVKKWLSENAIIVLMLAVSLIVGIIHPNFFAVANLINLFKNVSIRYIIALGISGCLITTGNDLSAGRLAGFAACLACIFAQTEGAAGKFYPNMPTLPTPVVFILVIAICSIVGLCNGLVVSYLKVQPFIATLGMQQVVYGICLVYTGGTPIGSLNKNFTSLASNTIIGIPVLIWIALVVAACFWFQAWSRRSTCWRIHWFTVAYSLRMAAMSGRWSSLMKVRLLWTLSGDQVSSMSLSWKVARNSMPMRTVMPMMRAARSSSLAASGSTVL